MYFRQALPGWFSIVGSRNNPVVACLSRHAPYSGSDVSVPASGFPKSTIPIRALHGFRPSEFEEALVF
ncbi:hypothetical protein D3C86_1188920 [compost metagenome]